MSRQLPTNYPHLLPEDSLLWNDFLILHEPTHHTFMYDVAVGPGRDPGSDFPDNIRIMALQLSKRRLDVIGIKPDFVQIFELTQSAGLRSAGQAVVYPHLLRVTWQLQTPIVTTIICRNCQDDIMEVMDTFHIEVIVVPTIPRA